MPIYEFYCDACHTIYNFYSRRIDTRTVPACPATQSHRLTKKVSLFTFAEHPTQSDLGDPFDDLSQAQMEHLLTGMADEFARVNEKDPQQMARLMRKLVDRVGVQTSDGLQEALSRLERGDDPDQIEDDLGAALDDEDPFLPKSEPSSNAVQSSIDRQIAFKRLRRQFLPPNVDETLHDLTT